MPVDPTLTLVAADHRLTGLAVITHAKPIVMLVMMLLLAAIAAAIGLWARGLTRRDAGASCVAALGGIAAAAPLFGFFAAAYGLMDACIGIANVRPVPSLSILAPGLAEGFFVIGLGLLAAALATLGRHHLNVRLLGAAAGEARPAPAGNGPLARAAT